MKAFITGAAGFIGSNFVNRELSNPDSKFTQIVAFDSLTYAGSWSKINPVKSDLKLEKIVGDIRNSNQLTESIKGSDIGIHFAAARRRRGRRAAGWSASTRGRRARTRSTCLKVKGLPRSWRRRRR